MISTYFDRFRSSGKISSVAFNMRPTNGPWGGSSTFVSQMADYLRHRGYNVRYNLHGRIDLVMLIDPRDDLENKTFGMDEILEYKKYHPPVKILHRINECDQRKATDFMDKLLAKANDVADCTAFIAEWLRDYHTARWFDKNRKHTCIYNGADPRVFHPIGNIPYQIGKTFRIVTHHWSNNWLKGFETYQEIDNLISRGELPGVEFWVIGQWPETIRWKATKTFPPSSGYALGSLLRQCHAYVTASKWEPGGMHHVEGAQCGLPLIYHEDGGGIVEAGRKYGISFRQNVGEAIVQARSAYDELRGRVFRYMPSGDRMCHAYADLIQEILCR
jgi:glycosyltransferase involved in cell wall biosynthesis